MLTKNPCGGNKSFKGFEGIPEVRAGDPHGQTMGFFSPLHKHHQCAHEGAVAESLPSRGSIVLVRTARVNQKPYK